MPVRPDFEVPPPPVTPCLPAVLHFVAAQCKEEATVNLLLDSDIDLTCGELLNAAHSCSAMCMLALLMQTVLSCHMIPSCRWVLALRTAVCPPACLSMKVIGRGSQPKHSATMLPCRHQRAGAAGGRAQPQHPAAPGSQSRLEPPRRRAGGSRWEVVQLLLCGPKLCSLAAFGWISWLAVSCLIAAIH